MKKRFLSFITMILAMIVCTFSFVGCSTGPTQGFDYDLALALGEKLDIDIEFELIDWDTKVVEINSGTIDLIWNGMTIRPKMYNELEISNPYLQNNQVMVVAKDSNLTRESIASGNAKIVAEAGSVGWDEASAAFPGKKINTAKDQVTCLTEVLAGNYQVAVLDSILAGYYIANNESDFKGKLKVVTNASGAYDTLSTEEYGIAAKKGNKALIAKVNDTLYDLYKDGTMQKIARKYGLEELLITDHYENYTKTFDSLSASEKAKWDDIVKKGSIKVGYTLFAPICY